MRRSVYEGGDLGGASMNEALMEVELGVLRVARNQGSEGPWSLED